MKRRENARNFYYCHKKVMKKPAQIGRVIVAMYWTLIGSYNETVN